MAGFKSQRHWVTLACVMAPLAVVALAACSESEIATGSQVSSPVSSQLTESLPNVATSRVEAATSLTRLSPEIWEKVVQPATGLTYEEAQQVKRILGVRSDGGYRTGISDALMQGNRHLHVEGEPSVLESVRTDLLALGLTVSTVVTDGSPVTTAIMPT